MGENEKLKVFPYPIKNNLLPAIGDIDFDGAYTEEIKLEKEIPKIFGKQISVHATAVRVP
jgi:Aspartate-semialdehyde dehydrogenase